MDNSLKVKLETVPARPVARSPRPPVSTSVLLIFIDGVGIGTRGEHNPLDGLHSEVFSIFRGEQPQLPFGGVLAETDARLGVEGLPQSATGQTTILTGVNGAQLIGRHLNGYPSPRLKQALAEHSIYKKLMARGPVREALHTKPHRKPAAISVGYYGSRSIGGPTFANA